MDKADKKKLEAEKKRIRTAEKTAKQKLAEEVTLRCVFTNLETKGIDLEFVFNGQRYHYFDGQEYDMPLSVIEHLNSLKVPVMKYQTDPKTGNLMPKTEVAQMLQRFSVTPVNLREYTDALKETNEGKGVEQDGTN